MIVVKVNDYDPKFCLCACTYLLLSALTSFLLSFPTAKLPRDLMQDDIIALHALQDAITILFSFKRMGNVEGEFSKDIDIWLSTLVRIKVQL